MAIILASYLNAYTKDELGHHIATKLQNENNILDNIKKYVTKLDKFVFVANDQFDRDDNVDRFNAICQSLKMSGLDFKENILLDYINKENAKEIINNANLVILGGGKCLCQKQFFIEMKMYDLLEDFDGLVIGVSAGAMNLCETVANFPEEFEDLEEPRWFGGLGFFDPIIIPHFDGKYNLPYHDTELANDYIWSMSKEKEFLGIANNAYILIDGEKIEYYGDIYSINNEIIIKIN